ncbi:MAG: 30S ribosomal protein S12 methylthiotransferase RimO, partial [Sulfurospirillum sp.]|nr:30S ribosomal protein S12 methylthiotransferase RimO [Sulfurospirillum sp.]
DKIVQAKTKQSFEKEVGKEVLILIEGESSEHELFMGARELLWAPGIDGEILVNDSEVENVSIGACYRAKITELVGDKLVATITALA